MGARILRKCPPRFSLKRCLILFMFSICCLYYVYNLKSRTSFLQSSNPIKISKIPSTVSTLSNANFTEQHRSDPVENITEQHRSDPVSNITDTEQDESNSVANITEQHRSSRWLVIESVVLFSDFRLVIVEASDDEDEQLEKLADKKIGCIYHSKLTNSSNKQQNDTFVVYDVLSVDGLDGGEPRWVVRCPIPGPSKPSGLQVEPDDYVPGFDWLVYLTENQTEKSWGKMLAYEAAFDGEDTVAVFAKGLRLKGATKSNPSIFSCRFGKDFEVVTKAVTAAQEVIRCPLPPGVTKSSIEKNNEVVQVTIEREDYSKVRRRSFPYVLPSIANLYEIKDEGKKQGILKRYELCACTMVWNQAPNIREWVIYHAYLGIQRWFVYDNNSDDELKEVIRDLNSQNYNVSRHGWAWVKSQEAGFAHCLLRAREQCDWVAFFDVDEYFYLPTSMPKTDTSRSSYPGHLSLGALVKNVASSSPNIGEIRANCYEFGPSGLTKRPVQGVTQGYTCRLRNANRHKSIVRPDAVDESLLNRIHHFELREGFSVKTLTQRTGVVNHYKYQVWDAFKVKYVRIVSAYVPDRRDGPHVGSHDTAPGLGTQDIEPPEWHKTYCEVWDTGLRDFIVANLVDPRTSMLPWQSFDSTKLD